MNSKQKKVVKRLLEKPERSDIEFKDVESLFSSLGFQYSTNKSGSRVQFRKDEIVINMHKPHSKRGKATLKIYQVKELAKCLKEMDF